MTRKNFEMMAKVIKDAYYLDDDHKLTLAYDFADELSFTNPRFDRDLFLAACGVK